VRRRERRAQGHVEPSRCAWAHACAKRGQRHGARGRLPMEWRADGKVALGGNPLRSGRPVSVSLRPGSQRQRGACTHTATHRRVDIRRRAPIVACAVPEPPRELLVVSRPLVHAHCVGTAGRHVSRIVDGVARRGDDRARRRDFPHMLAGVPARKYSKDPLARRAHVLHPARAVLTDSSGINCTARSSRSTVPRSASSPSFYFSAFLRRHVTMAE
jgi:hypothetical protein